MTHTLLFWGIWLIIPLCYDGIKLLRNLIFTYIYRLRLGKDQPLPEKNLPPISIVIPCHNEEQNITHCLHSLITQTYPSHLVEIIIVDDGSTDATIQIIEEFTHVLQHNQHGPGKDYQGHFVILKQNPNKGKAEALNRGFARATGEIVINVDADAIIGKTVFRQTATYFHNHQNIAAATCAIEISWDHFKHLRGLDKVLTYCEFLEYLSAFEIGRFVQGTEGTMFTLSGAFSAFRAQALTDALYEQNTVAEDTDMTCMIKKRNQFIGFIPNAYIFVEPCFSLRALYAQRLRWRRGQIEVTGKHLLDFKAKGFPLRHKLAFYDVLLTDHTLAFPRLIWSFLVLILPFWLSSFQQSLLVFLLLYAFYILLDASTFLFAYPFLSQHTRKRLKKIPHYIILLPIYRMALFYIRISAYIRIITDRPSWNIFQNTQQSYETSTTKAM